MISEMAMEDIKALKEKGYDVSPEDIVRLNAFGVKAENNKNSVSFYAIPRCVYLDDDFILREPTLGHEIWYDQISQIFDMDDERTIILLRIYMMSMPPEQLPEWSNVKEIKKALNKFAKKCLIKYTIRQMLNAMYYCVYGNDHTDIESVNINDEKNEDDKEELLKGDESISHAIGIVRESKCMKLGITQHDINNMSASSLQAMIQTMYAQNGIDVDKQIKDKCIGDYYKVLGQLKEKYSALINNNDNS